MSLVVIPPPLQLILKHSFQLPLSPLLVMPSMTSNFLMPSVAMPPPCDVSFSDLSDVASLRHVLFWCSFPWCFILQCLLSQCSLDTSYFRLIWCPLPNAMPQHLQHLDEPSWDISFWDFSDAPSLKCFVLQCLPCIALPPPSNISFYN